MAAHYVAEIVESNPTGPYAIAGYSLGGIIAFEMVKILKVQNRKVSSLIMLDSYVYPTYNYEVSFKKTRVHLSYSLGQVAFVVKMMLLDKENFSRWLGIIKSKIKSSYLRIKLGREAQHKLEYPWPLELDDMHRLAVDNYQIIPEDLEIDLLKVEDNNIFYAHDTNYLGWREVAKGGVIRHVIPGNHKNMFQSPNDKALGQILQAILDRDHD
ncbi:thioesterase domain-containing protein [Algibacter lectus]|nr:thioesterase domain-containing protein [Algibacter lectus]